MNFGKLYTDLTKLPSDSQEEQSSVAQNNETEAHAQVRSSWKSSTVTQEIVSDTVNEINDLIASSVSLAVSYPTTNNHQQIIQNLIRVDTLKKFLDKYIYSK